MDSFRTYKSLLSLRLCSSLLIYADALCRRLLGVYCIIAFRRILFLFLSSPVLAFDDVSLEFLLKHLDSCLNTFGTIERCIRSTFLAIFTLVHLFMLLKFCLICQHSVLITENTEVHLFFS